MTETPLISIIAVNWNTTAVTGQFLQSILSQNTYPNIEVIIVDNASAEDPTPALTAIYPGVKVVRHTVNAGYAGGNNVGIKIANGDFLFIVNNDTELTPDLLKGLLDVFRQFPDAGIVCPKFHYFFDKGTIEYAGYNEVNVFTGRNSMIGHGEKDNGQYDQIRSTAYAHGGGMMIPARVIKEVGRMPEQFFLYYEELDWSEQMKRKGYKIYYQPAALIYHKESMTTGKSSPLKVYYLTRNRILFMRRNATRRAFLVFAIYFSLFTIPKNSLMYIVKGRRDYLRVFWKGILWHFNSSLIYAK